MQSAASENVAPTRRATQPPPTGASMSAQLDYWIQQTSKLSDTLIEAQLRCSSAEAEVARLAPLEAQWSTLASEARTLSQQRADALVENARLSEWNEQMKLLNAEHEKELQQLRRLLADKDSQCAQWQSQVHSAQSAHSAAASALTLQSAYQSKLAELESALADSQRRCADHSALQFNFQVLHAKYEHLKKLRAEDTAPDTVQSLTTQNQSYRAQMEQVASEMESIRTDLLGREEERARMLDQVATLTEQNTLYRTHVSKATRRIEQLQHGMLMARTRLYQIAQQMREQHQALKRDCVFMIQQEQSKCASIVSHVLAHVSSHERRMHRETQQLQSHLQEDHWMHALMLQKQEAKMRQMLDISTGAAVTSAQLQQRKSGAATQMMQQQSQPTLPLSQMQSQLPLSQLQPAVMPLPSAPDAAAIASATPVVSATPIAAALAPAMPSAAAPGWPAAASVGFDVRDWLSMQSAPPPPAPVMVSQPSLRSSPPPPIFVGQSPHRLPAGYAPAIPSFGTMPVFPRAQFQPLAVMQQQPTQPLPLHSYLPAAAAAPAYPNYSASAALMSPDVELGASPSLSSRDSRSIHVQRLAEVEAALDAMSELEHR